MQRWKPVGVALTLVAALAGQHFWEWYQTRLPRIWGEVYVGPGLRCYNGPPRREIINCRLWPGGPGLRLEMEQRVSIKQLEAAPGLEKTE